MGFVDVSTSDVLGASAYFDLVVRQGVLSYADVAARDADTALTAALAEGLLAQTLDDETIWRYDGSNWEILLEREKPWTSPTIDQGGVVTCTVDWGSYKRSYGRWDAALKVTFTASGTGGNAIGISTPFDVIGASGTFMFFDDSLGKWRQGGVLGVADDVVALVIDLSDDLFGIAGSDGITADDVLILDLHGSY